MDVTDRDRLPEIREASTNLLVGGESALELGDRSGQRFVHRVREPEVLRFGFPLVANPLIARRHEFEEASIKSAPARPTRATASSA